MEKFETLAKALKDLLVSLEAADPETWQHTAAARAAGHAAILAATGERMVQDTPWTRWIPAKRDLPQEAS